MRLLLSKIKDFVLDVVMYHTFALYCLPEISWFLHKEEKENECGVLEPNFKLLSVTCLPSPEKQLSVLELIKASSKDFMLQF